MFSRIQTRHFRSLKAVDQTLGPIQALVGPNAIFAKNNAHADFIAERFNANYPHYKGQFARVVTYKTEYAQSLIDDFSAKDKAPHIAISVDMLDTGIDVPEVVNLVFFKVIRSKTKFWQMVGRGTRLCPDLYGPGQHQHFFNVFDYCQNLEFFSQNPDHSDGAVSEPLSKRLFKARRFRSSQNWTSAWQPYHLSQT